MTDVFIINLIFPYSIKNNDLLKIYCIVWYLVWCVVKLSPERVVRECVVNILTVVTHEGGETRWVEIEAAAVTAAVTAKATPLGSGVWDEIYNIYIYMCIGKFM